MAAALEQIVARSGDSAPGIAGAQAGGFSGATLNDAGQIAFLATLRTGPGDVTAADNGTVWRIDGVSRDLVARSAAAAPGGGAYQGFTSVSIGSGGDLVLRAAATSGRQGVWRYPGGAASAQVLALTGERPAPALPAATLDSLGPKVVHAPHGPVAFDGGLSVGVGGVSSANDFAAWLLDDENAWLLGREGIGVVPGVPGGQYKVLRVHGLNRHGQVAVLASLAPNLPVTATTAVGVWRLGSAGGDLIARVGTQGTPGVEEASFSMFRDPTINAAGQIAFTAELELGGGVSESTHRGVWRYTSTTGALLARSGSPAPGTDGAVFMQFGDPLLNDAGQTLVCASLAPGVGEATASNGEGLWLFEDAGASLLARTGVGGVPGVPEASFGGFYATALNESGVVAVKAMLAGGGVTEANDQGIWLLNSSGGGELIVRKGESIDGRTIAALDFTGGSAGGDGLPTALNASGQLVYKATFTNGEEAILLHTTAAGPPADFDGDGDVDGNDLARWRNNFRMAAGAAAAHGNVDSDGDVDGVDLLQWQRQLTGQRAAAVPEPAACMLAALAGLALVSRRGGRPRVCQGPWTLA